MASARSMVPGFFLVLLAAEPLDAAAGRRVAQEQPASACPAPPINPTLTEQSAASGEVSAHTVGIGGAVAAEMEQGRTYAGTGLSQEAADQAFKVYQLCLQAEKGLIPKEVYVEALRSFYGFQAPQPTQVVAAAPPDGQVADTSAVVAVNRLVEPTRPTAPFEPRQASEAQAPEPPTAWVGVADVGGESKWIDGEVADTGLADAVIEQDETPDEIAVLSQQSTHGSLTASPQAAVQPTVEAVVPPEVRPTAAIAAAPAREVCFPVARGGSVHARMRGTIGVNEALAWSPNARVGWLWSTKAAGLGSQMVRIWPDGTLDVPGALDLGAGFQSFSTMDTSGWISRAVEGTVWGRNLVDVRGWRVVGDGGVVVALKEGAAVDLSPYFDGGPPAAVYQLPVVDESGSKSLVLSMDSGTTQVDTLIRTWWVDTNCL